MDAPRNLYVHFPFCRGRCTYCALHSRAGVSEEARTAYVRNLADEIAARVPAAPHLTTVYFGGGSPALCALEPLFRVLAPRRAEACEWTVELHPRDVSDDLLRRLKEGGVNRISMGVQSLDDATLAAMRRGYTIGAAERAFAQIRRVFDNAGIDLILGYPGDPMTGWERLANWGLAHCSVYSLIVEEKSILARQLRGDRPRKVQSGEGVRHLPSDDVVLDKIAKMSDFLHAIGLDRYEISNYARAGFACRHNLAVWRGEDYWGLGEGASGRLGLQRTHDGVVADTLTPERDEVERTIFRLRTREGLETAHHPTWGQTLQKYVQEGLLTQSGTIYRLTARGTEVCDSILAELV